MNTACVQCKGDAAACRKARRDYEQENGLAHMSLTGGLVIDRQSRVFICDVCVLENARIVNAMIRRRNQKTGTPHV